jgi:dolichyl-phosphate-mannose--protein O-mannosyl transferase
MRVSRETVQAIIPGLLFASAMLLYSFGLATPRDYVFDEVYHAYTAGRYVEGDADAFLWNTTAPREGVAYMWNHPPTGILIIAGGILVWGNDSFGWRLASAVFGAIGLVMVYGLARALGLRVAVSTLAAVLLLFDGLYFAQSRIGMLDIFGTVFALGALTMFYRFATASSSHGKRRSVLLLGLFLGLAISTKWNAAYLATFLGLGTLGLWIGARRTTDPDGAAASRPAFGWVVLGLAIIPAVVYLSSYLPFFATGHGIFDLIELQKQIFLYHTRLEATHPFQSNWWQWPLTLGPVWYDLTPYGEKAGHVWANGNPCLHVVFVPAVVWVATRWWMTLRRAAAAVLIVGFFGQWLPWALVPRIAFAYHFLPAATVGAIAVAVLVSDVWSWRRAGRVIASIYVAAVVASFVWLYPILAGVPLARDAIRLRLGLFGWG